MSSISTLSHSLDDHISRARATPFLFLFHQSSFPLHIFVLVVHFLRMSISKSASCQALPLSALPITSSPYAAACSLSLLLRCSILGSLAYLVSGVSSASVAIVHSLALAKSKQIQAAMQSFSSTQMRQAGNFRIVRLTVVADGSLRVCNGQTKWSC